MRLIGLLFVGLAGLTILKDAHAIPIAHAVEFKVENILVPIDPRVKVGNSYFGYFEIDDAILAADGLNKPGSLSAFRIQFENLVWDMNLPDPISAFHGFRGPGGLGVASPGFDVVDAAIRNLRGGVYGVSDSPFVDFSLPLPNSFVTNSSLGAFSGSLFVHRIAEPTTFACVLIGLAGLAVSRRRQPIRTFLPTN